MASIPQPLGVTKQLPPSSLAKSTSTTKRVSTSHNHQPILKKPRPTTPKFKVPSLPPRFQDGPMTPSTSTVANSSSPPRLSSPTRTRSSPSRTSPLESVSVIPHQTLIFGRHRHLSSLPLTSIPATYAGLLHSRDNSTRIIQLSRAASHASRIHATVEYVPASDQLRLVVMGQNGLRIKTDTRRKWSRLSQGQSLDISRRDAQVEIDFYGSRMLVDMPEREERFAATTQLDSPMSDAPSSPLPPSSPPLMSMDLDLASESESEPEEQEEVEERGPLKEESPLDVEHRTKEVKESKPLVIPVDLPELPATIDLPALLASTVVFSGSSKLSLPDLVKGMLEAQPSLKEHGDESLWRSWAGVELERNEMFGKVSRVGKDVSGHPLLSHYFYNPALDPDTSRARELGSLVRPLRNVQRGGGKAIDWRPVGRSRRY
ncbi:hypothetical protein P7C73_g3211, partial [Tremellales sp. Uapishka_1]